MQCFGSPQFPSPFGGGCLVFIDLFKCLICYIIYICYALILFLFLFFILGRSGRCPKRNPKAVEFWRSCRLMTD